MVEQRSASRELKRYGSRSEGLARGNLLLRSEPSVGNRVKAEVTSSISSRAACHRILKG